MIINEEYFALEDQTFRLVEAICSGEAMSAYKQAKRLLAQNEEANAKIRAFNEAKEAYERVEAYADFAPGYQEIRQRVYQAKRLMDLDESVYRFRAAERELQLLLDKVSERLAHAISPNILVSAGDPFFQSGDSAMPAACQIHISSRGEDR
nr:YlbF family regulator [uncultured Trichococcus sp.]